MKRKDFIKNGLLATGTFLLPNSIWAFEKGYKSISNISNQFLAKPNLKKFKISESGTKFFETELSINKPNANFNLHRKFFISENTNGICTPAFLETNKKEHLIFIPELYQDKKHNGFIVKLCENGLCEETKIFTHENQGYYAFWGKEYFGNPTLYHYNVETFHLMRMHLENGHWINHRVMPIYPDEMTALYQKQLQEVQQGALAQQFGYDFEIHKDGFYQLLSLKNDWEQSLITKEKEDYEKANPAKILTTADDQKPKAEKPLSFDYTNPFVPIYCKGDDLTHATVKPTIIYEEVAGTKIEIENMPAYKTQDDLGDCKAFSVAAILQQYVNTKWKSDIPDPKNPPADMAISHFGLMAYTNQVPDQDYTFRPNQKNGRGIDEIINNISKDGNQLIIEDCKSFDNLTKEFSLKGNDGLVKRDEFLSYLKNIYTDLQNENESNIKECSKEITTLNSFVNLNFNQKVLKKALTKNNFDKFLYTFFFDDCKKENFPAGFRAAAFPLDSMDVTPNEVKAQIIKGLNRSKPVILSLCVSQDRGNDCSGGHLIVISGFKKVIDGTIIKDVFKLHNSWGAEWQKKNNDGWCDADILTQNTIKVKSKDEPYRIGSASVIWLDP